MCSHYQAAKARHVIEKRFGVTLPLDSEPPRGSMHLYPTQIGPIVRRPPEMQDKRMVAILPGGQWDEWLDAPAERSVEFLRPYPAELMLATPEPVVKAKAVPDMDMGLENDR
jgi:putative SOS response-associated peptidase YedK